NFPSKTIEALSSIKDEDGKLAVLGALESGSFPKIVDAAKNFLQNLPSKNGLEEFMLRFSGALFEIVATRSMEDVLGKRERIIPINEVFEVFAKTYPEREPITNGFGLNLGIDGVRLPDGIIVHINGGAVYINAFCEYSLNPYSLQKKAWRYNSEKRKNGFVLDSHLTRREELKRNLAVFIRGRYPELPRRVQFDSQFGTIYVMPRESVFGNGHELAFGNGTRNRKFFVPLTHRELRKIAGGIIEDLSLGL
ncbi:MAG: hypothetical protein HYS83_00805, partial [Candidatus Blackburnbacteria bacterium]|nr:hypothetical protein [Candidatus Blackburnbacteria bacterium]